MKLLIITKLTILETLRRKIALMAAVWGLLFLIIFSLGFNFIRNEQIGGRADLTREMYKSFQQQDYMLSIH